MAARKLAVAAELFRRNPEDGFEPSPGAMPEVVSEFAADQRSYDTEPTRYPI